MKLPIYMDYQATSPTDPRVVEAMTPYFFELFGNAASRSHHFGWQAAEAVEIGRERIAALAGATAKEIVFTSGATESDNLALKGVMRFYKSRGDHLISVATEHKAVLDTAKRLEREGFKVTFLPVNREGLIDLDQLRDSITGQTVLVSAMLVNNEIGVIQPVKEIGEICKEKNIFFHTDAAQAFGKVPFNVDEINADLVSLSAHKMYGPKGIGALFVRRRGKRIRLMMEMDGGGHERGMRSGTLNVPGIVGFGKAAEISAQEMAAESQRILRLREKMRTAIMDNLDEVYLNGSLEHRVPGNLNISFAYVEGESLMMGLKDVAVSSGSACTSASLEPSYVLRALGVRDDLAHTSIRFGLGRFTTEEEVDYVSNLLIDKVTRLREMSPLYEMAKQGIDISQVKWAAH